MIKMVFIEGKEFEKVLTLINNQDSFTIVYYIVL